MQTWLQLIGVALTVLLSVQPAVAAPQHGGGKKSHSGHPVAAAAPAKSASKSAGKSAAKSSAKSASKSASKSAGKRSHQPAPPPPPAIELEHLTTHASYKLRPDSARGGFSSAKLRAMMQLLRCHHTGKRHAINERLVSILYATSRHYHNAKLLIVAGYRAPAVARQKGNPKSPHKRGVACDFQVAGVANEAVRDYIQKTYHKIGLGYYPRAGFVHVDVGRTRDAYWIDYSSPGQPARYSKEEESADPAVTVAQSPSAPEPASGSEVPEKDPAR